MNSSKISNHEKVLKLTQTAFIAALIVVLQVITYFVKIGPFNMSFVLIPIVVGGLLFGPKTGAFLGGVFGLVVTILSAAGVDGGGFIVFSANPVMCVILCMLKGILAGFVPAVVYKAMNRKKQNSASVWIASIFAPICNTGVFCLGMYIFFYDVLQSWAGGTNVLIYTLTGLVGINFIIEFCLNLILSPVITKLIMHQRKK